MPNPLIKAAVMLYLHVNQVNIVDDSTAGKDSWKLCVVASSLEARFGLNIDSVKTCLEGFEAEKDIPSGKQGAEVFKILKDFHKTTKDPPSWFSQWKENKAAEMKDKKKAEGSAGDEDGEVKVKELTEAAPEAVAGASEAVGVQAAAAAPAPAAEAAVDNDKFKVGDVVMGIATKSKEKWAQKCEITGILSTQYKVKMLEGTESGKGHKFLHACVKAIPPPGPELALDATAAVAADAAKADAPGQP